MGRPNKGNGGHGGNDEGRPAMGAATAMETEAVPAMAGVAIPAGEGVAALSRAGGGRLDRGRRSSRLKADRELLAVEHPYLSYDLDERRLTAAAQGAVPLGPCRRWTIDPIEIRIEFRLNWKKPPSVVFDVAKRWLPNDDRHIPADHSFCLYLREASTSPTWPPAIGAEDLHARRHLLP